ncbi:MAG: hypothetical protein AAGA91_14845 [Pseudomonadota bacterium]
MTEAELPEDVIQRLQAGRKVAAIKRLRAAEGLSLEEAIARVDRYIERNPVAEPEAGSGIGRILLLIAGVAIIFGIYSYLT